MNEELQQALAAYEAAAACICGDALHYRCPVHGEAVAAPAVPDGWKLVPVEPTTDMKQAAINVDIGDDLQAGGIVLTWYEIVRLYRAMLEAAPAPEGGEHG